MKERTNQQGLNWFDHEQSWALYYFSASWCAPCKTLVPIMAEISAQHKHHLNTIRVDVDEQLELVKKFDVRSVPTLILSDGLAVKSRLVGGASTQQINRWLAIEFEKEAEKAL